MRIKIKVTSQHIRDGIQGDGDQCAIACAMQEVFPGASVGEEFIYLQEFGRGPVIETPSDMAAFINYFDNAPVAGELREAFISPRVFYLNISDDVIAQLSIPAIEQLIQNSLHLELVK